MKRGHSKSGTRKFGLARLVGENFDDLYESTSKNSDRAHRFAGWRKKNATAAERKFEQILRSFENGFLAGKFEREWAICGKWILDFYFPKYRLAIEIDGSFHSSAQQVKKDAEKATDCQKLEISLLRFTNEEVFGDQNLLLQKLKDGLESAAVKAESCTKKYSAPSDQNSGKLLLTKRERFLIKRHFEFYKSLATGTRLPETIEQKHFVAVCQGKVPPQTEHEIAFAKFIKIQSLKLKKK